MYESLSIEICFFNLVYLSTENAYKIVFSKNFNNNNIFSFDEWISEVFFIHFTILCVIAVWKTRLWKYRELTVARFYQKLNEETRQPVYA